MALKKILQTEHPYIVKVEGVCGGSPIIKGTRTPVKSIVCYYKIGETADEIVENLPFLNHAQVYDALSYYYDHMDEIDKEIEMDEEEYWMKIYPPTIKKYQ
ncbi:MAG: DUF433 domain-containing protein [Methanosarcinales archaeon]